MLRTLALEPGEHDLLGVLNDNIADGRDVSWIWDADFELLAGRVRRVTCSGSRAAELAVRLKYAGIDPARIRVQPDLRSALARPPPTAPSGEAPLYALPTYTAMLVAARAARRARGGEQLVVVSDHGAERQLRLTARAPRARRLARPRVRRLPRRPAAVAGAGAERARRARVLDVGAGTGRVALELARAGHEVTAVDLDPTLLDAPARARRRDCRRDRLRRRALVRA